jgi:hypothetical protein
MNKETTKQVTPPELRNPEGKGGFGEHPENRSNGRWSKENSQSYWLHYFDSLTIEELKNYLKEHPETEMTVACAKAYHWTIESKQRLDAYKEVTNRTEGMPKQTIRNEYEDDVTEIEFRIVRNKDEISATRDNSIGEKS